MSKALWYYDRMLDDATRIIFPASGEVSLPLLLTPLVLRCMAAGPGGHPLTVLLDTGTDPSAIDLGLARRLDLRLGEFVLGSDAASDSVAFTETVLPWLRLGDLNLRDLYAVAMDLSRAPFKVDLVLGYNVLSQLTLSIDYAQSRITLRHPDIESPAPGPHGTILPLHFADHFPALVNLELLCGQQRHTLPLATIDTGSNGALTLGRDVATCIGLYPQGIDQNTQHGRGFTSAVPILTGARATLHLGPFILEQIEIDAPASGPGDLGRAGRVNIGNRLLARFGHVGLDYRRGWCMLG